MEPGHSWFIQWTVEWLFLSTYIVCVLPLFPSLNYCHVTSLLHVRRAGLAISSHFSWPFTPLCSYSLCVLEICLLSEMSPCSLDVWVCAPLVCVPVLERAASEKQTLQDFLVLGLADRVHKLVGGRSNIAEALRVGSANVTWGSCRSVLLRIGGTQTSGVHRRKDPRLWPKRQ